MTAPDPETAATFRGLTTGCILSFPFWVAVVAVTVWVIRA